VCIDRRCVNACVTDRDCSPGALCVEGSCFEPAVIACAFSHECNAEEICLRGRCRPECHDDRDCDNGFRCAHPPNLRTVDGVCAGPGSPLFDGAAFDGGPRFVDPVDGGAVVDATTPVDAGIDAGADAAPRDGGPFDAGTDAGRDAAIPCMPGFSNAILYTSLAGSNSGASSSHFCGVTTDARVACWGDNTHGQLGRGVTGAYGPTGYVAGILDAAEVVVAREATCVRHLGGTVSCFGRNDLGQLGNGTTVPSSSVPVPAMGLVDAMSLAAGADRICATRPGARPVCWGEDQRTGLAVRVPTADLTLPSGATQVAVAENATCALAGGTLTCLRENGTATPDVVGPGPTVTDFASVRAGQRFFCGVRAGPPVALLHCFGNNSHGQLANMTVGGPDDWIGMVALPPMFALSPTTPLALGARHGCLLDTTTDRLHCWGDDADGQGTGTPGGTIPLPVATTPSRADFLAAGPTATCGGAPSVYEYLCQGTLSIGDGTGTIALRSSLTQLHNCPAP
jgi:hypothetical protein